MTIAIGTMYQQTMILAADREVTIPDYMKSDKGKIHWTVSGTDMLAVTGAGEVAYLDAAFGEVMSLFHRKGDVWAFGNKLDAWLQKFYKKYVISFGPNDRPEINLIVAARKNDQSCMWVSSRNKITPVAGYAAVGSGNMTAMALLGRLGPPRDVQTAQLLAAYAVYQAKESVPGCGKHTDVVSIDPTCTISDLGRHQTRALEAVFEKYGRLEAVMVNSLLGGKRDGADDQEIRKALDKLKIEVMQSIQSHADPSGHR